MKTSKQHGKVAWAGVVATLLLGAGCASTVPDSGAAKAAPAAATPTAIAPTPMPAATPGAMSALTLSGAQEVPPNPSSATGNSTIAIGADRLVKGSITVTGMAPTMAHIHEAVKGVNGPVIVPFVKSGANTFVPAPGATLTDAQYASYLAGKLYLNVHSATYPGGEIRVQLAPGK